MVTVRPQSETVMGNLDAVVGTAPVLPVEPSVQPANAKAPVITRAANLAECRTTLPFHDTATL
jgi:hypothetical protein